MNRQEHLPLSARSAPPAVWLSWSALPQRGASCSSGLRVHLACLETDLQPGPAAGEEGDRWTIQMRDLHLSGANHVRKSNGSHRVSDRPVC